MQGFKTFVDNFQKTPNYRQPLGFGIARVDIGKGGKILCASYPLLNWQGENLGTFAVLLQSALNAKSVISENQNEALYGVNGEFLKSALELYSPFLSESLSDENMHKNIQIILELQKVANKGKLMNKKGEAKYRFCVLYADEVCSSVELSLIHI